MKESEFISRLKDLIRNYETEVDELFRLSELENIHTSIPEDFISSDDVESQDKKVSQCYQQIINLIKSVDQ
jgi:hypothetical protein